MIFNGISEVLDYPGKYHMTQGNTACQEQQRNQIRDTVLFLSETLQECEFT